MGNMLGYHIGNEGPITDIDWQIMEAVKPGYVTLLPNYGMHGQPIGRRDINCILTINPGCHFVLRPYLPGTAVSTSVAEFGNAIDRLLDEWSDWVPAGQKHLQLFNEPNMPISAEQWEGFGDQLADMMRYNEVWLGLVRRLRANHPDWLYGWGPLTIGNRDVWFPGDAVGHYYLHGPAGCQASLTAAQLGEAMRTGPCYASLMEADEFYAHVYIHRIPENTHDGRVNFGDAAIGLRHERMQLFLPRPMPTVITEAGYPNTGNWPTWAGPALLDWLDILHTRNNVAGVCLWILGEHWGGMWYSGGAPRAEVGQLAQWQCAHSGVPMTDAELERILGDELQAHIVPLNPDAALEKAAARRGLLPASDEVRQSVGGTVWVAQAFRKAADAKTTQHLVRTREGEWAEGDMRWWIREN